MDTSLWNFPAGSPHSEGEFHELSDAQTYSTAAKLAFFTYRIGHISSFISAAQETLRFLSTISYSFYRFSVQILEVVEAARKTLETEKVIPYLWASCPEELVPHKTIYIELLRALQSNERYIDIENHGRLRVLLMPLTSGFAVGAGKSLARGRPFHNEALIGNAPFPISTPRDAAPGVMLPPSTLRPPQPNKQTQTPSPKPRAEDKRLWRAEELTPPPSKAPRRKELRVQWANRENASPGEEQAGPFRPVRSRLRFGICFSAKSPINGGAYKQRERATRVASVRSLMNPKE